MDIIRPRIDKLKSKVNFKFRKKISHEGLKIAESFVVSRHVIVSKSFDITEKTSQKRIIISLILNLSTWFVALKSLIMYFLNNRSLSGLFGAYALLFNRSDIPELVIIILIGTLAFCSKYE